MNKIVRSVTMATCATTMLCIVGCGDVDGISIGVKTPGGKSDTEVTIKKDDVKKVIAAWQVSRWKSNEIEAARKKNGKVTVDDLKVQCNLPEIQPLADLLVADYIITVNLLDAFAGAPNETEAMNQLIASISVNDVAKMLADASKVTLSLGEIKDKISGNKWKFMNDAALITHMSMSMNNGAKVLMTLLENDIEGK